MEAAVAAALRAANAGLGVKSLLSRPRLPSQALGSEFQ
jgi:hypothetical protein